MSPTSDSSGPEAVLGHPGKRPFLGQNESFFGATWHFDNFGSIHRRPGYNPFLPKIRFHLMMSLYSLSREDNFVILMWQPAVKLALLLYFLKSLGSVEHTIRSLPLSPDVLIVVISLGRNMGGLNVLEIAQMHIDSFQFIPNTTQRPHSRSLSKLRKAVKCNFCTTRSAIFRGNTNTNGDELNGPVCVHRTQILKLTSQFCKD